MNPDTNSGVQPAPEQPNEPHHQPFVSSSKLVIQPLSETITIDPEPVHIHHDPQPVAVPTQTSAPTGEPSHPSSSQPGTTSVAGVPTVSSPAKSEPQGMGMMGIAVTAIGALYIMGGVLSVLSGLAAILSLNLSGIVPIIIGSLYVYLGKGLIQRNETARFWALVIAWISIIGSIGSLAFVAVMFGALMERYSVFLLIALGTTVFFVSYHVACVIVLNMNQVKRGFTYRW